MKILMLMGFLALFGCSNTVLTVKQVNDRIQELYDTQDERFLAVVDESSMLSQLGDALSYILLGLDNPESEPAYTVAREAYNAARYYHKKADLALMEGDLRGVDRFLRLSKPEVDASLNAIQSLLKKLKPELAPEDATKTGL